jgi:hypothetical protein
MHQEILEVNNPMVKIIHRLVIAIIVNIDIDKKKNQKMVMKTKLIDLF